MGRTFRSGVVLALVAGSLLHAAAATSKGAQMQLSRTLLGKDVKALLDMPAYKDGIDIYVDQKADKRYDQRGIDLKEMSKYLKEKGVGVERDEWVTLTDVKVDSDRVEISLGGGGEGGGASKQANKKGAGYKRAGGSRINLRYGRELTDADIQPAAFLSILDRVLDTSKVQDPLATQKLPEEFADQIRAHNAVNGMSYQMVLLSMGEPDQKKVDDSSEDSLHETWFYLKDGHRWVVRFVDGKVAKVQIF